MKKLRSHFNTAILGLLWVSLIGLTSCTKSENPGPSNTNTYGFNVVFDNMPYAWSGLSQPDGLNGCSQAAQNGGYVLSLRTDTDADTGIMPLEINCSLPSLRLGTYSCTNDNQGGPVFSVIQRDLTGNRTFRAIQGNTVNVTITQTSDQKGGSIIGSFSGNVIYISGNPNTVIPKAITGSFTAIRTN